MKITRRFQPVLPIVIGIAVILSLGLHALFIHQAQAASQATVRVSGAWALFPMMQKWAIEYQKSHPNVMVEVTAGGAGKGATDALGGLVNIGMISRDIHPEEIKRGAYGIAVVKDAVLPTINERNPMIRDLMKRGMKLETFVNLWIAKKPLSWGQIAGKPTVRGAVRVYTRSDACGAADTWAKYLGKTQEDLQGTAVYGDPGVAQAVSKDIFAIGYNNLNYAYNPRTGRPLPGVRVVPIDINGNGKVDKQESFYGNKKAVVKAIASGVYPSPPARDLFLMTKGKPTGATRDFIRWILKDGQKFVDAAGYIQLPKAKLSASVKRAG